MKVETKKFKTGAIIYLEGKANFRDFYIIKSGKVKIIRKNSVLGNKEEIQTSGFIFGIIQCITNISENESVEAFTDCEIIIIHVNKLEELYKDHPNIILKILSEYSEILRELDHDLIEYDVFYNFVGRNEKVFNIASEFLELNQQKKAAHLLKTFLQECNDNELKEKAKKMLEGLSDVELLDTKDIIEVKTFVPETVIFTELERGTKFFVIKKGKVKITKLKHKKEVILAIFGAGNVFGEMAILNDKPRTATAVAEEVSEIMVINKKGIGSLPSSLFVTILKYLTERIWFVKQQLICLKLPTATAKLYFFLTAKISSLTTSPVPTKSIKRAF